MPKNVYRSIWLICLALAFSMACLAGIGEQVDSVKQTAQSAVDQGKSYLATAQAFATLAPSLLKTAQAFATDYAPLIATARYFATEQGPEMMQTADSLSSGYGLGKVPEDIPLAGGDKARDLVSSNVFVSYTVTMPAEEVAAFYEAQMPANGWQTYGQKIITEDATILQFEKPGRRANVVCNHQGSATQVVITIETQ
ncbi:MAG: hypothetical protein ACOYYS_12410 [Chloroflexota bacterium]